jgi:hypothetical protein
MRRFQPGIYIVKFFVNYGGLQEIDIPGKYEEGMARELKTNEICFALIP